MGNSQAVAAEKAARVVCQLPNGELATFYQTLSVSQVTKDYPGHQVALLIFSAVPHGGSPRVTHLKLLGPSDNLLLGNDYTLISSKVVKKVLRAKAEKMKKIQRSKHEKQRGMNTRGVTNKVRAWKPSLQSISGSPS